MTHHSTTFAPAEVSAQTKILAEQLGQMLRVSMLAEVQALTPDAFITRASDSPPAFTLAFVGQYDAGKSSIISALTGRRDIVIDADVCTSHVTAYPWHDLMLLDTPGVQAGYTEHDEQTAKAILRADLIVFVITAELFSETTACYFRRLMFEDGKAKESMLVVNKLSIDNGSEEVKRPHLDKVCSPATSHDFCTVFMDAKSYLESIACDDEQDKLELREVSKFDSFIAMLNQFARERCDLGRITQPLFKLRAVAEQACALASVDNPAERAAIELLGRLEACVNESQHRLRETLKGVIGRVVSRVESEGDDLADMVHQSATQEALEAKQKTANETLESLSNGLGDESQEAIGQEMLRLQDNLAAISESSLGKRVLEDITQGKLKPMTGFKGDFSAAELRPFGATKLDTDKGASFNGAADYATKFGDMFAMWGAGPKAVGGGLLRASEAAGGQAHKAIYEVGKFFGKNFKPWEAVKYAKWFGNAGRLLGALGPIISIVSEYSDEIAEREQQKQLMDTRTKIRFEFREMGRELSQNFWAECEAFEKGKYGSELASLAGLRDQLVGERNTRSDEAKKFAVISARANELIQSLHQN